MTAPKRTKFQREHDLNLISRRYLSGVYQADIAEELQLSQQQISYDLKTIRQRWLNASVENINEAKARELAKVDNLELEYWAAWKRSQEDAETVKQKGRAGGEKPDEIEKTAKGQAGDPRFLAGVQWCIERRCAIMGIDAPKKTDLTSGGKEIHVTVEKKQDVGDQ